MLSYSDCVGLSELTPEEIAVIAQHEHLPDIVALEMGAVLHGTAAGRQLIRRMIIENSKAACRRGDTRTAAQLGLVLHHFIDTHLDRHEAAEQGLREEATTPPIREHVDNCLPAMLHHFGVDLTSAQERFGSEMRIARMCCAACTEASHCRRFLAGATEEGGPSDFCPNAPLLDVLGHSPQRQEAEHSQPAWLVAL